MRRPHIVFIAVAARRHAHCLLEELTEGLFIIVPRGDHGFQHKNGLGLAGKLTKEASWRYVPPKGAKEVGAQIDLLIDRDDHSINICEIKFYTGQLTISKSYAGELQQKLDVFQEKVKPRKTLFLTLITTYGIKDNIHSDSLVKKELTMDVLFD